MNNYTPSFRLGISVKYKTVNMTDAVYFLIVIG